MFTSTRRPGSWAVPVSVLLFVIFGALAYYHKFYNSPESQAAYQRIYAAEWQKADEDLSAELVNATFLDDEPAQGPDWPQWRGPSRNGVAHAPDLLTHWPNNGPTRLWEATGQGYSAFAVADGRAYTLVTDGKGEAVVCWNAADGKECWRARYGGSRGMGYPGPRATPTVEGDRVWTLGASGQLYCLDARTGAVRWQHDLVAEFKALGPNWGQACSPLIEGRLLIVSPGGRGTSLMAFDKETGAVVWQALDDPAGYSSPVAWTTSGVRQVVCFTGDAVLAVSPRDGKLQWRLQWETANQVNAATPLLLHARKDGQVRDYVFISSNYGKGCALLKIMKTAAGDFTAQPVYQNNKMCSHFTSPVRRGNYAYGFNDAALTCMDLRSGDVLWKTNAYQKGALLRVDGYLLVLGESGKLALMDASPDESRPLSSAQVLNSTCWTMPVLCGGRLFLRDDKKILCLDLSTNQ